MTSEKANHKKRSLVVKGPDKYSNPFSYEGRPEENYIDHSTSKKSSQG